jgi:glucokinase
MYPYIVADIGGTNARFALVTGKKDQQYVIDKIQILNTHQFAHCADALRAYLESVGRPPVTAACLAVAGPVVGDRVRMTNLNWDFSCTDMAQQFGFKRFVAMNDFAAVAAACGQLTAQDLVSIKEGVADVDAPRAVFGPGTGLGVAGLVKQNRHWLPIPCEGGHVNMAPANALEADIIKAAMKHHGHVSAEVFISGPGLVHLYRALCDVQGEVAQTCTPADITHAALNQGDALMAQTLSIFCSFAGTFAGNLALTFGAKGGIYLAGGVLPRFVDYLKASDFNARFLSKGPMSRYVESVPVNLIIHPETAFVGAAAWLEQHL